MKNEIDRNIALEGALIACYKRYEHLVTGILRDKKLSNDFSSWCLKEDLRAMYAEISEIVFADAIETHRDVAKFRAGADCVKVTQALNFYSTAELEGYEKGVRDWIRKRLIPKKQGEAMIKNHRAEYAKRKDHDDAKSFALALVRFGSVSLREIYEMTGEDFYAAFRNFKKQMPEKAKEYSYLDNESEVK